MDIITIVTNTFSNFNFSIIEIAQKDLIKGTSEQSTNQAIT